MLDLKVFNSWGQPQGRRKGAHKKRNRLLHNSVGLSDDRMTEPAPLSSSSGLLLEWLYDEFLHWTTEDGLHNKYVHTRAILPPSRPSLFRNVQSFLHLRANIRACARGPVPSLFYNSHSCQHPVSWGHTKSGSRMSKVPRRWLRGVSLSLSLYLIYVSKSGAGSFEAQTTIDVRLNYHEI